MVVKRNQPFSDDHPFKGGLIIIGEQAKRMKESHDVRKKTQHEKKLTTEEKAQSEKG